MENGGVRVKLYIKVVIIMMVIGLIIRKKEMVKWNGSIKVKSTLENGNKINFMVLANIFIF